MSRATAADGIDHSFDRAMRASMREDARKAKRKRYAVGRFPVSGDWTVDLLDGPCKIALRGADGEVLRFATREEAEAHHAAIVARRTA